MDTCMMKTTSQPDGEIDKAEGLTPTPREVVDARTKQPYTDSLPTVRVPFSSSALSYTQTTQPRSQRFTTSAGFEMPQDSFCRTRGL